ncbi:YeeE/YedE family protein [Haliangium sp.]|uniref:YeeE/YedE family protein n=1 Tax=Haliangium sp. TaxID=2663208 RepID=UPI003D13B1E1
MTQLTPYASFLAAAAGGVLIGLASILLLLGSGRIAGISGILGGALRPRAGDTTWRVLFLAGLVVGGAIMLALRPEAFAFEVDRSLFAIAGAGLLVGFGTRLGSGCTSGHGVCGMSRLSPRSLVATVAFMAAGAVTVVLINRIFGGAL